MICPTALVDPGFRIIDQQEAQLVAQRAVEDALMGEYEQVDDDLAALNALRGPDEIRDMVLELHTFLSSRADADEWLSAQTGDAMREKQRDIVRLAIKDRMKRVHAMLNGALRIAREDPDAGIYEQALERDIAAWPTGDDLVVLPVFEAARFAAAKGTPRAIFSMRLSFKVRRSMNASLSPFSRAFFMSSLFASHISPMCPRRLRAIAYRASFF